MIWFQSTLRFGWRFIRNFMCCVPVFRRMLFPPTQLALRFGSADAGYSLGVFAHHFMQLEKAGFAHAERVLEVGPGPNLGTALLWWTFLTSQDSSKRAEIVCWDVFSNVSLSDDRFWMRLAAALLDEMPARPEADLPLASLREGLLAVAEGRVVPSIVYRVEPLEHFVAYLAQDRKRFDLVYSQAAIEHVWFIDAFWTAMSGLTEPGGWHSHRIDLADHGRRESNYIEMLQWSRLGYWLTMRFVPGAINRWRACHHLEKLVHEGFAIVSAERTAREALPVPLRSISMEFRNLEEIELRTTALDVVARKQADS